MGFLSLRLLLQSFHMIRTIPWLSPLASRKEYCNKVKNGA